MIKRRKSLLSMLLIITLFFSNVKVVSATEITESGILVQSDDATDNPAPSEESEEKDEELTIPAGVWSDEEPLFTDDVPAESEKPLFQLFRIAVANVNCPTYQEVYEALISLKEKYPEGMTFTNFEPYGPNGKYGEYYTFKGGYIKGARLGRGCAGFAFEDSDTAFGSLPARTIDRGEFSYEDIKVGDILRVDNGYNGHFVIVLQVSPGGVIVAEANYNKSVHWGRAISRDEVMYSTIFLVTRYPVGYSEEKDADEIAQEGTEGSLHWTLTNGGVLTISATEENARVLTISSTGDMPNYTTDNRPSWDAYIDKINTIIIESGVTSIGDYAFYESKALTVYIPDGVTSIGTGAFQGSSLVAVTIPGTTASVGANAFRSCNNLTSATIPEGVKTIGDNAFRACRSITYLDFPSTITSVGAAAFTSCDAVVQIRFAPGTGKVTIGDSAFAQCQRLMAVTLPQGLTKISNFMFQSCTSLDAIYISSKVTDIGENPFTSTAIQYGGTIYFGSSQATWRRIGGQFILNSMPKANIVYNVEFEDPFAIDPNDPGDFEPADPDEGDNSGDDSGTETDTSGNDSDETDSSGKDDNTETETTTPSNPDESDETNNSGKDDNTETETTTPSNPDESDDADSSGKDDNTEPETSTPSNPDESDDDDNSGKDDNTEPETSTPSNPDESDDADSSGKDDNTETTTPSNPDESDDADNSGKDDNTGSSTSDRNTVSSVSNQDKKVEEIDADDYSVSTNIGATSPVTGDFGKIDIVIGVLVVAALMFLKSAKSKAK